MKFKVCKQSLNIECVSTFVSQTIDYLEAYFSFSDDWDGLVKYAHFKKAEDDAKYIIQLHDDKIEKDDHLNLTKGVWFVWVHGDRYEGGQVTERITTTTIKIVVKQSGLIDEIFPEYPLTDIERLEAEIRNEADLRTEADSNLQEQIDELENTSRTFATKAELEAEAQTRAEIDSNLARALSEEITARGDQDDAINRQIVAINNDLTEKADKTSVYTKQQTDNLLNTKADVNNTYTKAVVDAKLADKTNKNDVYTKNETYNRQEVDRKVQETKPADYDAVKAQVATNKTDIANLKLKKMEKHLLEYDGTHIKEKGFNLTFNQLYDILMASPDFAVLVYQNFAYHPNGVSTEQIVFSASYPVNGLDTNHRITMLKNGIVTKTDVTDENIVNKVSAITEQNKTDEKKYPNVKAVYDALSLKNNDVCLSIVDGQLCVTYERR